ncbi:MAG: ornithine decarboxylase [Cryptosporangiaceae bacterium]|nr:ornithine decarboxylase [Cryptosporangiaceae bacterium]
MTLRHIEDRDWPAIVELEASAYADCGLSEGLDALQSRAFPATSFVLDAGGAVAGYLLALPYPRFRYPDLARPEADRFDTSNLHLHDLVIAKRYRGLGLARRLLARLTATARDSGYGRISLVAVAGTAGFWSAQGYRGHPRVPVPAGYGPDAAYMSRTLVTRPHHPREKARQWPAIAISSAGPS